MSDQTPSLEAVLGATAAARAAGIRVSMPGIVVSYNAATQRAEVQPCIMDGYLDEEQVRRAEKLPVIPEVPIVFPGNSQSGLTWPVRPGDEVWISWSSSSIDRWLARGGVVDPGDDRRQDINDAVAFPGAHHAARPATTMSAAGSVLAGQQVLLGGSTAIEAVVKGTTYLATEAPLVAQLAVLATALAAPPAAAIGGTAQAAAGTLATLAGNYATALATFLSAKVKTE